MKTARTSLRLALTLAACSLATLPLSSVRAQSGGIDPSMPAPGQPAATQPNQPASQPGNQPGARGAAVDLRPKLEKGKSFRFKMKLDSTEKQTPPKDAADPNTPQEPVNATQEQEIVLKLTVKDSNPETGSTLELVYESLKMRVHNPMLGEEPLEFDSTKAVDPQADPSGAAIAEMLGSVVGTTLTISMDRNGNVTNVSGAGGAPGLGDSFTGKDVISGLVGQVFTLKSGEPIVHVGEKWTNDSVMAASWGRTRISTSNTLTSHSGGKANIAINGKVSMEPNSPGQPLSISIKDSNLDGSAVWNTEEGMLDAMSVSQTLDIDITSPAGQMKSQSTKKTVVTRLK